MSTASIEGRRICVVDDDDMYREFLKVLLGGLNARVCEARSGQDLIELLDHETFDCVLLDYHLQSESGLGVHESMLSKFERPPPVVILTGTENNRTIIKAFRRGVSDYVLKRSLRPEELLHAIHGAIERHQNESSDRDELTRLKQRASFDDLTGVFTFQSVQERMEQIARGGDRLFAVMLIAFNEFDLIVEKFGSVTADQALRTFASRLRKLGRRIDVCGRRGRATFVYLMDADVDPATICDIASRLERSLNFTMNLHDASLDVSATVGAAMRCPESRQPRKRACGGRTGLGERAGDT